MRVTCNNISEFLECLERVRSDDIVQKTIRVSIVKNPPRLQKDEVKMDITIQASAVVNIDEEGQYLLEAGEYCGIDYHDASKETKGSKRAAELKDKIRERCKLLELEIKPGIIDM